MTIFLLKLTLAWGFFALLYALLLRQETFFRANRAYLLSTAALGILLALPIDWLTAWQGSTTSPFVALPIITVGLQQTEETVRGCDWLDYLWFAYWAGTGLAMLRMSWGLARIARMAVSGERERLTDGCVLVKTEKAKVPFSFFKWVFVPSVETANPQNVKQENVKVSVARTDALMLAHERAHAHGWHSVDVLFVELLCVVFWFHPLAHWYRKAIRAVHEYLADAEASRQTDIKQYGLLLIRQAQPGMSLAFVNHFFQSPLKQRLIMLTRNASPALRAWKYGLALPVLTLIFLFTRQTPALAQKENDKAQKGDVKELTEVEQAPQFPGGQEALLKFLATNIQYPEAARRDSAQGVVAIVFVVDENGAVTSVGTPEGVAPGKWRQDLVDEAVRVVKLMPAWQPAISKGKPVKVKFTLPIKFKLQ